jgi:DNA-binding response OmpR family regulator
MAQPTVASRLQRRLAFISDDAALAAQLQAALPEAWVFTHTTDLAALGDFATVLQYRFLLLDLDAAAFDPLDVIDTVRRELMLNVAILCIGGDPALRDAARLARADRFFGRDAAVGVMLQFCSQYDW